MRKWDALDGDKIKANLRTKHIGRKIVVYNSTSSTNDVAAEYARNKGNDGLVVLAEEQTKGRGRGGNKWLSSYGDSVLCSILLTDCKLNQELLSLACAVAVAEAIGRPGRRQAKIKWPNDIILNGKKAAGILVESKMVAGGLAYVIGIGINCRQRQEQFPTEIKRTATSIDTEAGRFTDRNALIKRVLILLEHWLDSAARDSDETIEHWRKLSIQLGHRVSVIYNRKEFSGNCIGVDPRQGLILQLDTGSMRFFPAGQSTITK